MEYYMGTKLWQVWIQYLSNYTTFIMTKAFGLTWIRPQFYAFVLDRGLNDVVPRTCAIWDVHIFRFDRCLIDIDLKAFGMWIPLPWPVPWARSWATAWRRHTPPWFCPAQPRPSPPADYRHLSPLPDHFTSHRYTEKISTLLTSVDSHVICKFW